MTKEQLIEIFGKEINSEGNIETEVHNIIKTIGIDTSYSKGYKLQDISCYFDNDEGRFAYIKKLLTRFYFKFSFNFINFVHFFKLLG
jgi:hypothetical protein